MQLRIFLSLLVVGAGSAALAETVVINDQVAVRETNIERPARGMSMQTVEARFGAPEHRHASVGDPPITRWDYPGFSVFFEHQLVIHAVAKG